MLELFKLAGRIDLNGQEQAEQGLSDIDKKAEGVGSKFGSMAKKVGKAGAIVAGAVTAAAGAAGVAMVKYGNMADELLDLSAITGMSTDEMQRWRQLAVDAGVDTSIVTDSLQRLNGQIERGNQLSPRLAKGFDAMGISAEEFKALGADEQMRAIVGQMLEMEGADRRAFANQMNMADMLPLIAEMESKGKSMDEIMNEIDVPFGEDELNIMNNFRKTWDNFKQTIFEVTGQALMPLFNWFNANLPLIQTIVQTTFDAIGAVFSTFYQIIQTGITWFQSLFTSNQETMSGIWTTIQEYFGLVVEYLMTTWEQIKIFWQENGQAILENAMTVFQSIYETVQTALMSAWEIIQQVLALVVPFIQEKLAVIQQFWDENGQQIMQAVQNAFAIIQSIIQTVMPVIQVVIQTVWNIIKGIFNGALNIIMGLIKTFSGLFTGDWSKMWEGVKQLLSGALEFIWNLISITLIGRGISLIKNFASAGINLFKGLGTNAKNIFNSMVSFVTNLISRMVSGVLNFFRSMGSGIKSTASGILSNIKNTFNNMLSFVTGLGGTFLNAGKGLIDQMAKGIKNAAGKVIDTVKDLAGKVRDFLPFSPAKVGPLSDLDKLDFEGPISDSIAGGERNIKTRMSHLLTLPDKATIGQNVTNHQTVQQNNTRALENKLDQLIAAVQQDKIFNVNGRNFAKAIGDDMANEGGERLRYTERGLAT